MDLVVSLAASGLHYFTTHICKIRLDDEDQFDLKKPQPHTCYSSYSSQKSFSKETRKIASNSSCSAVVPSLNVVFRKHSIVRYRSRKNAVKRKLSDVTSAPLDVTNNILPETLAYQASFIDNSESDLNAANVVTRLLTWYLSWLLELYYSMSTENKLHSNKRWVVSCLVITLFILLAFLIFAFCTVFLAKLVLIFLLNFIYFSIIVISIVLIFICTVLIWNFPRSG